MNLTPNFTLAELTHSDTAIAKGIDNTPPAEVVENLRALAQHTLQPLRDRLGRPISITSGYRCPDLNRAIGSAPTSQHTRGEAADLVVDGLTPEQVYVYVKALKLPFDQVIIEKANGKEWLHISYSSRNRREALRYDGTTYTAIV